MRAAVVREFNEDLSIESVEDPSCPDNGVVLEVAVCGVCRSDFHGWVGRHPKVTHGSILGHEYCGTVVEAGAQAKHKIGDRLIAPFILCAAIVLPVIRARPTPAKAPFCRVLACRALMRNWWLCRLITTLFTCQTACHPLWPQVWDVVSQRLGTR